MLQAPAGGLGREVAHRDRGASSAAACAALTRSCLDKAEVPVAVRVMVARACVLSRGLYQAGCWPVLSKGHFARVAAGFHRPFRVVAGANRPPPTGVPETSNVEVRSRLAMFPLE